jgi:hypothetical protein
MAIQPPDWLSRRGGTLHLGSDRRTWYVMLDQGPRYSITPTPVRGKYGAVVTHTNNGKRFETAGIFSTPKEAVQAGLEDLRMALGW